nr:MAG TPA: Carbamoyl phosphate synthetase [Caudoviricetes sp.]
MIAHIVYSLDVFDNSKDKQGFSKSLFRYRQKYLEEENEVLKNIKLLSHFIVYY